MKYNIYINQIALNELAPDLNVVDAAILDYIITLCNSKSDKVERQRIKEKDQIWTWIDMGSILKDMPLLKMSSKSALTPRFKKLQRSGFIDIKKKRIGQNYRAFVKLDARIDLLFIKNESGVHETGRPNDSGVHETGPTITTTKYNTNTMTLQKGESSDYSTAFLKFWEAFPKKEGKAKAFESFKKIDPIYHEKMFKTLDHQIRTNIWSEYKFIPQPTTWLNQKRWEDEIPTNGIDYAMESYARELARQYDPEVSEFKFSAKYGVENLLKFRHILGL